MSGAAFPWNSGKYLGHYGCGSTAFFPGELDSGRVVTGCEHPGLRVLPPPLEIDGIDVHVAWHRRRDNDPALGWLRTRIAAAGQEVQTSGIGEGLERQRPNG